MSIKVDKNADNDFRQRRAFQRLNLALATAGSPLTTKGDLFGFSTSNARIPVGSDGSVLIADSSQATGVRWGTVASASVIEMMGTTTATDTVGTSTTSEVDLTLSSALFGYTFGANTLTAGSVWKWTIGGNNTHGISTFPRFRAYFGGKSGVLLFDTNGTFGTTGVFTGQWYATIVLRVISTGATGSIRINGSWSFTNTNSQSLPYVDSRLATVDTTATNQLTGSWKYANSNANNAANIQQYFIERMA